MTTKDNERIKNHIEGSQNIIGNNNNLTIDTINIIHTLPQKAQKTIVIRDGEGYISSKNKAMLKNLINKLILTHNEIKRVSLSYAVAWSKLNKYMKVESYHAIEEVNFEKAKKFLQIEIAKLNRMPSAKKKNPKWRAARYTAIHARVKQYNLTLWKNLYMEKEFNKVSLSELDDNELEKIYSAIMKIKSYSN